MLACVSGPILCQVFSAAVLHVPPCCREGVGPETANKVFDPMGLSALGSPATLKFFRAAEIKHGRVAMVHAAAALTDCLSFLRSPFPVPEPCRHAMPGDR